MDFKLIAEIGVNHLGSVKLAKEMIDAGANAGVNLFKFQIFTVEELGENENWQWYNYMNHCALSKEQHFELNDYCNKKGVTYFASVFGDWSFDVAQEMDMCTYKIASRSLYNDKGEISELAKKIYATGKPSISSLGYRKECWTAPLEKLNDNLYCVSKYPTVRSDIRWPDFNRNICVVVDYNNNTYFVNVENALKASDTQFEDGKFASYSIIDPNTFEIKHIAGTLRKCRTVSGFSDHSIGTELAKEAIDLGATIIEKHFTIDKTLFGPDQKGSSLPSEFKEISDYGNNHYNVGL